MLAIIRGLLFTLLLFTLLLLLLLCVIGGFDDIICGEGLFVVEVDGVAGAVVLVRLVLVEVIVVGVGFNTSASAGLAAILDGIE